MWLELIIDAGMMLPAKQPGPPVTALHARPVLRGSRMLISRPCASKVCEKSPCRSSADGMRHVCTLCGRCTSGASIE